MKARKGQYALTLDPKMDIIESVRIRDEQAIWVSLQAQRPEQILPLREEPGFPRSYCFIADKIFLDRKLAKSAEIEVIGLKYFKQ